jgi:hypothetical protein
MEKGQVVYLVEFARIWNGKLEVCGSEVYESLSSAKAKAKEVFDEEYSLFMGNVRDCDDESTADVGEHYYDGDECGFNSMKAYLYIDGRDVKPYRCEIYVHAKEIHQ